jgi:hypothetical protein
LRSKSYINKSQVEFFLKLKIIENNMVFCYGIFNGLHSLIRELYIPAGHPRRKMEKRRDPEGSLQTYLQ